MLRIQLTLSRKTDADLISFFTQQDGKAAALTVAALFSYIQGTAAVPRLLPVTVAEQMKSMNLSIILKKQTEDVRRLKEFLDSIPNGMRSVFIKGILRYTYGSVLYQTEATIPRQNTPPPVCETHTEPPEPEPAGTAAEDDVFGLFESLLG